MKNTSRNKPRRAARATDLRDSLEARLLKVCADIGWICGWRTDRLAPAPPARRSSRKRVMLGRVLAAEARGQKGDMFHLVEATSVSGRRTAYAQTKPAAETDGLADFAIELNDELTRLDDMGISSGTLFGVLGEGSGQSLDRRLREPRRSAL
ncbi:hypothetical protein [Lysobacter antibioticus]|uniref:hypothetical protein n=1 Tax=Lysobacter antibioticus TaxID=84531 RepID=UPI00113FE598|nr:hypothetical protein [Lysobacter antibioticus]